MSNMNQLVGLDMYNMNSVHSSIQCSCPVWDSIEGGIDIFTIVDFVNSVTWLVGVCDGIHN